MTKCSDREDMRRPLRSTASVAISGAAMADESAQDMMKKALGTTENVDPVIAEAFERAASR